MTYAKIAVEVLKEAGEDTIWLGNFTLWSEVYSRKNRRAIHPIAQWKAVLQAVRLSKLFVRNGYIKSVGFIERESKHPVFKLINS